MIEETLLKSNFLGKDGFIWWLGQVAPADVWDSPEKVDIDFTKNPKAWAYRCKVRIVGYHTFNRTELSDNDLPWAHVMLSPTDGNAQGGLGKTHKLLGGETVFGFYLDGDDAQQPVIMGVLYRNSNVPNFDIDEIAFKPFTGVGGGSRMRQGSTKQTPVQNLVQQEPNIPPDATGTIIGGRMVDPVKSAGKSAFSSSTDKFFPVDRAIVAAYRIASGPTIVSENGCDNNVIGKITREIQNFIAVVSGLESYLGTYVDPVLNKFVDITTEIRRTARIITGSIKFLINNMRNMIMKMVGCLFSKFVGLVIPIPQQPIVGEATKNILNIIFCLFEKIIDLLLPFLEDMLKGLVGRAINAPLCAVEEFTATILNKMIDDIDGILGPVMSGLDWLLGGYSQVKSILSTASSIATQIFNFIGCDNLKCNTPSEWALNIGPTKTEYDNWNRVVDKMNTIRGFNQSLETSVDSLSIYGSSSSIFRDCANRVKNPKSQKDVVRTSSRSPNCLPPEIEIYGDGVGASAIPVIGANGSILSIEVLSQGVGYNRPPKISIVDRTGCGGGAAAESVIENGRVTEIYLTTKGSGYAETDLRELNRRPYYLVTANKYTFFEGETCTFTVTTENVPDGTTLRYQISGDVSPNDIENPFAGRFVIFNRTATIPIKIARDSVREVVETLIFDVLDRTDDVVARATVLINDRLAPILQSPLGGPESPPGTTIPPDRGGTTPPGPGPTPEPFPGPAPDPFPGPAPEPFPGPGPAPEPFPGPGPAPEPFPGLAPEPFPGPGPEPFPGPGPAPEPFPGPEPGPFPGPPFPEPFPGPGISTLFPDPSPGIGTDNVGIITSVVITTPGIGYTSGDSIKIGSCVIFPIVTDLGSIVGVSSIFCPVEFRELPDYFIDSREGEGVSLFPVLRYTPKLISVDSFIINEVGVLKVVDCI